MGRVILALFVLSPVRTKLRSVSQCAVSTEYQVSKHSLRCRLVGRGRGLSITSTSSVSVSSESELESEDSEDTKIES